METLLPRDDFMALPLRPACFTFSVDRMSEVISALSGNNDLKRNGAEIYHLGLAGYLNDLYAFDLPTMSWMSLGVSSSGPSPRYAFGCTSALGKIWIFGGLGSTGKDG